MVRTFVLVLGLAILTFLAAGTASAQAWLWVSLDGSAEGTVPTVELQVQESDAQQSTFHVQIHGYFQRTVMFQGQSFEQLRLPGAAMFVQRGRPALPELRLILAIPTATDSIGAASVQDLQTTTSPGIDVFPAQADAWDFVPDDTIPAAAPAWDQAFYSLPGPYPTVTAQQAPRLDDWRGVQVRSATIRPFQAQMASHELVVHRDMIVTFLHPGGLLPMPTITRRCHDLIMQRLDNAAAQTAWIHTEEREFHGCMLLIAPPAFLGAADALAVHENRQGYDVTIVDTDSIGGGDCDHVRAAVQSWHASSSCAEFGDAYVVLLADVGELAMCPTGFDGVCEDGDCTETHLSDFRIGVFSDDPEDIYQDVGVGRLAATTPAELTAQIAKIIAYETSPPQTRGFWGDVLLAASGDPGTGYIESAEAAASWPGYLHDVTFYERYGDRSDGTVAQAVADLDRGVSVVAYRGIGANDAWDAWDYNGQSLTSADVTALTNGVYTPAVFAIAGGTSGIDHLDHAMAETWLQGAIGGGIFHFGSTRTSGRAFNNELLPALLHLLYGGFTPTVWELTTGAQLDAMRSAGSSVTTARASMRQYMLLGLPDLKLATETPSAMVLSGMPDTLVGLGPHTVDLSVTSLSGVPVAGARVAIQLNTSEIKELYREEYTDDSGNLLVTDLTFFEFGPKNLRVHDDAGSLETFERRFFVARDLTAVPDTGELTAAVVPNPFNPRTDIRYRLPAAGHLAVRIYDARGRVVRELVDDDLPAGPGVASWNGTDAHGHDVAAGLYFFEVRSARDRTVGKMVLVR